MTAGKSLTKAQLAKEADKQLRLNTVDVLNSFWDSIKSGLAAKDPKIIKVVSEIYNYTKAPTGTVFKQNIVMTSGVNNEGAQRPRSFDQIISRMEDQAETRKMLAQPEDEDIIDVTDLSEERSGLDDSAVAE